MDGEHLRRLKELEVKNRKQKSMYADLALGNKMLKEVLSKKLVSPRDWRELQRPKSLGRPNARKGYSGIRDSRENWDILLSIFNPDAPCKMPTSSDSNALSVRMYWTPTSLKIFISSGKSPRNGWKITITIDPMNHSTTSHP